MKDKTIIQLYEEYPQLGIFLKSRLSEERLKNSKVKLKELLTGMWERTEDFSTGDDIQECIKLLEEEF